MNDSTQPVKALTVTATRLKGALDMNAGEGQLTLQSDTISYNSRRKSSAVKFLVREVQRINIDANRIDFYTQAGRYGFTSGVRTGAYGTNYDGDDPISATIAVAMMAGDLVDSLSAVREAYATRNVWEPWRERMVELQPSIVVTHRKLSWRPVAFVFVVIVVLLAGIAAVVMALPPA